MNKSQKAGIRRNCKKVKKKNSDVQFSRLQFNAATIDNIQRMKGDHD